MIVEAQGLRVRFRKGIGRKPVDALAGFDLAVAEGEFIGLLGSNGAGKSTAIYCFLGLTHPTSGSVTVLGVTPGLGLPAWRSIAYLPEEPSYHQYLTVDEAVRFYVSLAGRRVGPQDVLPVLERLGLAEFRRMRISKCSKGMKQKVGIAQCLLYSPRLLFLDEPMRGLDPMTVRQFREILAEMHRNGATVVMSSHILPEIEALATRVAVIQRGRVVATDSVANLTRAGTDSYAVEFQSSDALPDYLGNLVRKDGAVSATLPAAHLHDFMGFARERGLTVYSCLLERRSLEESFLSILSANVHD